MKIIDPNKQQFKGNTHAHSTVSDGRLSPTEVQQLYWEAGYDFLALTDHRIAQAPTVYKNMTVLCGAEYDFNDAEGILHIVGLFPSLTSAGAVRPGMRRQQLINAINSVGGAAILAHPAWSLNTPEQIATLKGLSGVEIYNSFSDFPLCPGRGDSSTLLDLAAILGCRAGHIAADDSHRYAGEETVSAIYVQAEENSPRALIDAIRERHYYASQGPRFLDVEMTKTELVVHTTPVCAVGFPSNLCWAEDFCNIGKNLTEHVYRLKPERGERFVRCVLKDAQGHTAWLSPQFIR